MTIKGDRVTIEYTGKLDGGEIFDSTQHGDHSHPFTFTVGIGEVISGLDNTLIDMNEGDEKDISILAEEAYGKYAEEMKQDVPKQMLPPNQEHKTGMVLVMGTSDGRRLPVRIRAVNADTITLDLNHPLAGQTLHFHIKVIKIEQAGKDVFKQPIEIAKSLEEELGEVKQEKANTPDSKKQFDSGDKKKKTPKIAAKKE